MKTDNNRPGLKHHWPAWVKDHTWQFLIVTAIAVTAIVIPLLFSGKPATNQTINQNGDGTTAVQVKDSHNTTVNVNQIDPEELAQQIARHLQGQDFPGDREDEIRALKATIQRLQQDPSDKLKQQALEALAREDTAEVARLMEQAARARTQQAAEEWIDVGNIAYYSDTQKALEAYKKAIALDDFNLGAWNRYGHVLGRLGRLDEAQSAYEKVLSLSGDDKIGQAAAYGNLGNIYRIRGDLAKAEEFFLKSLTINKELGRKEGMASSYGNLGLIYSTRGDLAKAEEFHQKALAIDKELGRKEGMASSYGNLGLIYSTRGDLAKACQYWHNSLDLSSKIGAKPLVKQVQTLIEEHCQEIK